MWSIPINLRDWLTTTAPATLFQVPTTSTSTSTSNSQQPHRIIPITSTSNSFDPSEWEFTSTAHAHDDNSHSIFTNTSSNITISSNPTPITTSHSHSNVTSIPLCTSPLIHLYPSFISRHEADEIIAWGECHPIMARMMGYSYPRCIHYTGPLLSTLLERTLSLLPSGRKSWKDKIDTFTLIRYFSGQSTPPEHDGDIHHTLQIYLNDVHSGGHTDFVDLNIRIQPVAGDALLIRNVVPNDTLSSSSDPYIRTSSDNKDIQNDSRTRHAECAPLNATKYMLISYLKDAPP